ncbi:DUF4886 domain-containing protein [Winogradskyella sp. R77965]|uniref:DUF4886 domain-containing protein n=1 Tax=Winogradskyella sp. R77965 TaxID=3093872 RepID=UPI0037DC956D
MKNILLIIIAFTIISCKSQNQKSTEKLNVLFVGNSFTFYHEMPQMVQTMLNETNPNIQIHQSTFPGMFLLDHLEKTIISRDAESINVRKKKDTEVTETEIKLSERKWDVIILQEGTVRVMIPELRNYKVDSAIKKIKAFVNNPNCRYILFSTWASKSEYPLEYCYPGMLIDLTLEKEEEYCSENIENLEQHNDIINSVYQELADNNKIERSNHTNLFLNIRKEHPEIELFDDSFHPSVYGSFLSACEFYQLLTDKNASGIKYNGGIESDLAGILKKTAE